MIRTTCGGVYGVVDVMIIMALWSYYGKSTSLRLTYVELKCIIETS